MGEAPITHSPSVLVGLRGHERVKAVFSSLSTASLAFALHSGVAPRWWFQLVFAGIEHRERELLDAPAAWGDAFALKHSHDLITAVFGEPVSGMKNALGKFPSNPMRPGTYRNLHACLRMPEVQKHIRHAASLDADLLEAILKLPAEAISSNVISSCTQHLGPDTISYCVAALKTVLDPVAQASAWQALRELTNLDDLSTWFRDRLLAATFPRAPWPGTAMLKPIECGEELSRVAQEFSNCLAHRVTDVISGRTVYYVWKGHIPAVASLKFDPFFNWVVSDMRGLKNSSLPAALEEDIFASFAEAGFKRETMLMFDFGPF